MATIKITAEGNARTGKTTVLAVLQKALLDHGFTNVEFVSPEENDEHRKQRIEALPDATPELLATKIELHEKFGTIERG